jgi:hypothetical protein
MSNRPPLHLSTIEVAAAIRWRILCCYPDYAQHVDVVWSMDGITLVPNDQDAPPVKEIALTRPETGEMKGREG